MKRRKKFSILKKTSIFESVHSFNGDWDPGCDWLTYTTILSVIGLLNCPITTWQVNCNFMISNVISYDAVIDLRMNLRLPLYYLVIERISKFRQWSLSQRSKKKKARTKRNTRAPKKHACEGTDTRDRAPFQRKVLLLCASRLTSRACRSKFLAHACQSKSVAPATKTISLSVILFVY